MLCEHDLHVRARTMVKQVRRLGAKGKEGLPLGILGLSH